MEKLVFTLKLKEVPVEITDENGDKKNYVLRELTSDQRSIFLDQLGKSVKITGSGGEIQSITDHKFLQENLVVKCILDEDRKKITREIIAKWPAKVVSGLFKAAQELSGLDEDGETEAKND